MTTTHPFSQPRAASGGAAFDWAEHTSVLVLIEPKGISYGIETKNGPADAVEADVTLFTTEGPKEFLDTLVFPKVIFSQCKESIGGSVLGRIAPYVTKAQRETVQLTEYTEADATFAGQYIAQRNAARAQGQFAQPAAGQPVAQAPVQQQAPAQAPVGYGAPPQATPPF